MSFILCITEYMFSESPLRTKKSYKIQSLQPVRTIQERSARTELGPMDCDGLCSSEGRDPNKSALK